MKVKLSLIMVALLAASAIGQEETDTVDETGDQTSTQQVSSTSTTAAGSTSGSSVITSTTSAQTSSPSGTTGTTRAPTTRASTTAPPETTTSAPESTTRRHSTTTRSSTTHRTTTTTEPSPVPTPAFPQNVGSWSVKGISSSCILLHGAFQIHLKRNSNEPELVIDVPPSVKAEGKCGSDNQDIWMNWWSMNEDEGSTMNNTLRLRFSKEKDEQYGLSSVKFAFREYANRKNTSGSAEISGSFFPVTLKHSFRCKTLERLETADGALSLLAEDIQFEAFRDDDAPSSKNEAFSEAEDCKDDHKAGTGTVLGVAVGIGLAAVVCIALVIYLGKRWCCRRNGYERLDTHT